LPAHDPQFQNGIMDEKTFIKDSPVPSTFEYADALPEGTKVRKVPIRQKMPVDKVLQYNLAECIMSREHMTFSIEFDTEAEAKHAFEEAKKFLDALGLKFKKV
jgi:hypothetical protein